jgi:hypothetical protein
MKLFTLAVGAGQEPGMRRLKLGSSRTEKNVRGVVI